MSLTSDGVLRWQKLFKEDPFVALNNALEGRVSLGQYDRATTSEALQRMLSNSDIPMADITMQKWLEYKLNQNSMPSDLIPERYADALKEAFKTIHVLPLPYTRSWCVEHVDELRSWIRKFIIDSSYDPEVALLVVLAYNQKNRLLLSTWIDVIRSGYSIHHIRVALMGLRIMPVDDKGTAAIGLPKDLLIGLLEYAETLIKLGVEDSRQWIEEVDFMSAMYSVSTEQIREEFLNIPQKKDISDVVQNWLYDR